MQNLKAAFFSARPYLIFCDTSYIHTGYFVCWLGEGVSHSGLSRLVCCALYSDTAIFKISTGFVCAIFVQTQYETVQMILSSYCENVHSRNSLFGTGNKSIQG